MGVSIPQGTIKSSIRRITGNSISVVSIPQGTIKSESAYTAVLGSSVSIPQGTIKSRSARSQSSGRLRVSIPQGTIKRFCRYFHPPMQSMFQFHKVRLKACWSMTATDIFPVSIPQGTIKSLHGSRPLESD